MKYLLSLVLSLAVLVLPIAAEASNSIILWVVPQTPFYPTSHHEQVRLDMPGGGVPPSDQITYEASAIRGNVAPSGTANPMGGGIFVLGNGIWAYVYQGSGISACPYPSFAYFGANGCLQTIPGLTLGTDEVVDIQFDWYGSPYYKWAFWIIDDTNNPHEIGDYNSYQDSFTSEAYETLITYPGIFPDYVMDSFWQKPMTWTNSNWTPYTSATVYWTDTSGQIPNGCPYYYGIQRLFSPLATHAWTAGSTFGETVDFQCSGWLWTS